MMNLLPPSAFGGPPLDTALHKSTHTGYELDSGMRSVAELISSLVSNPETRFGEKPPDISGNHYSSEIWDNIGLMMVQRSEQSKKMVILEEALNRTVPREREHRESVQALEDDIQLLKEEVMSQEDTITLLEKRLNAQTNVLEIQEGMMTKGRGQEMCQGWRNKVMQLLMEERFDRYNSEKEASHHKAAAIQVKHLLEDKVKECEVLCNKLSDQAAHIKLKDKHINVLSLELSNSQRDIAERSILKEQTYNERVCEVVREGVAGLEEILEKDKILDKVDAMQDRMEALSAQVRTLQCLAAEKEVFYSEKLESLLIQHTTGNVQSAESQTEGGNSEQRVLQLQHTLDQQKEDLCQLLTEKGLLADRLSEALAASSDKDSLVQSHRAMLCTMTSEHQSALSELQKRESKAAIRAKNLERQLVRKCTELEQKQGEDENQKCEEEERISKEFNTLRSENSALKTALRRQ